jgi:TolB-like protein
MKKCALIFLLIFIFLTSIYSEKLDKIIDDIVIDFSLYYKEAHPDLVYRPNLGIMPFEESSELAKKHNIGETITAYFENKIAKSLYFALIDDKSRNQLIKEMKFALSGLAETDRIEVGQLEGIDIFLGGTVTEADSNFVILVKAVEVNTGQVIYSNEAKIKKDVLVDASKEFMGAYVSPFGIGVDFYYSPYANIIGDMADIEGQLYKPRFFNANISYRISRDLLAWVGGDFYGGSIFTENGSESGIEINGEDMQNLDYTGALSAISAHYKKYRSYWQSKIGLGWVFNISKKFNITTGAEFRMGIVYLYQEYDIPHDLTPEDHTDVATADTTATSKSYNNMIVSSDSWLTSVKPLVKLQYFLSPRLALNAVYGFNWQFSESKASSYTFQDIKIEQTIPLLWNLDPSIDPEGNEHVTDLTGHRLDVGVSLYF